MKPRKKRHISVPNSWSWEKNKCFSVVQISRSPTVLISHYIEVAQENIFMGQKMRFGLVSGRWLYWKKIGADYEQLLRVIFQVFREVLFNYCSVSKKLHKIKLRKPKKKLFEIYLVINLNRLNILNQLCIALLKIPPCATSIYWLCFAHLVWLLLYFKTRSKYILRWMSRPYKLYNTYD